jgi:hydroxymethylbilane synthase
LRPSRRPIIIATRKSRLALAQSQAVAKALARLNPSVEVRLLPMETRGDKMLDHPLAAGGGKGLFTGALEAALLREKADLAVHSLKDMPTASTNGLVIAAVPTRGDVRDCLIAHSADSIDSLREGAVIGTASRRRAAQLARIRPDLVFQTLRGNIETRLQRVEQEQKFDATLLAVAGLQRGGFGKHAKVPLATDVMLPCAAQAALAIQCRAGDHVTLRRCLPLNDSLTAACVEAERSIIAKLAGDCTSPLAVLAEPVEDNKIRLRAKALSHDGRQCVEADQTSTLRQLRHTTDRIVQQLIADGARKIIKLTREDNRAAG